MRAQDFPADPAAVRTAASYRGPVGIPSAHAELLVAPDADALDWEGRECERCGLPSPYRMAAGRAAWPTRVRPCFAACVHCGGRLGWPADWGVYADPA